MGGGNEQDSAAHKINSDLYSLQHTVNTTDLGTQYLTPDVLNKLVMTYYNMGNQNLQNEQQRQLSDVGRGMTARMAAMNLSNPYVGINRRQGQVYDRFAGEFGNLELGRAQELMGVPKMAADARYKDNTTRLGLLLQILGGRQNVLGGMSQGSSIAPLILGSIGAGVGGYFGGPVGASVGGNIGLNAGSAIK